MLKAIVIVDNISNRNLKGEWGLSIHLNYNGRIILLDVGASDLFYENMQKLGLNISEVDCAVLSHAHYDHSNGMRKFFAENKNAKFYLRDDVAEDCYFKKYFIRKYIGIPRNVVDKFSQRIEFVSGVYELFEGVYLIPHNTPNLEKVGKRENMYRRTSTGWVPDNFSHEQSLVFKTDKGLVIFNSCSHGGAANIINEVKSIFPNEKVYGLIGGFHLFNKSREEVIEFADRVKETKVEYICTGHCTKDRAYGILENELGPEKIEKLYTGKIIEF